MKWGRRVVPILLLVSAGASFGQDQRPAPDPVQRAVTTARNEGRLTDAEKLLRDGISDLERNDPQSPRLPQYLRELAAILSRDGRNSEALSTLEQAYEIDRNAFAPNDLRLTVDITNLAWTAQRMGDAAKAEQLFNQALEITRAHEGDLQTFQDVASAAGVFSTVISHYINEKRWVDAELLMPEEEKLCGLIPLQNSTGYGCNVSGMYQQIYRGEGRTADAERADQSGRDNDLPPDLAVLDRTAQQYAKDGVYPSAEEAYGRAIALAQKLATQPHSRYMGLEVREMDALGRLYEKEDFNDRAEKEYLESFGLTKSKAGPEPEQRPFAVALNPSPLMGLYWKEGRLAEAEQLLDGVLEIKVADLGERHESVVNTLTELAQTYEQEARKDKSKFTQARSVYERAIAIQEQNLALNNPQMISLLRQYATLLDEIPDKAKAAEVRARIAAGSSSQPQK
jgi:tetratricopeptide (TPR) repeat protein